MNNSSMTPEQKEKIDRVVGEGETAKGVLEYVKRLYITHPSKFTELMIKYSDLLGSWLHAARNADPIKTESTYKGRPEDE